MQGRGRSARIIRVPRKIFDGGQMLEYIDKRNFTDRNMEIKDDKLSLAILDENLQTGCFDEPQSQPQHIKLLNQLQSIDYQEYSIADSYILQMIFVEIIKNHVRFIGYRPYSMTVIGSNLLTQGLFHQLWWKVIYQQEFIKRNTLKNAYYRICRHLVHNDLDKFQAIFQGNIEEESASNRYLQAMEEKQQSIQNPLPLSPQQIDKNCSNYEQKDEYSDYDCVSINPLTTKKLLKNSHVNSRRITAEMVCLFLRIPESRIFELECITIVQVHQNYSCPQFQLGIIDALLPNIQTPKTCIICYRLYNLEQLVRIQSSYSQIYGLITYDPKINIHQFLKDQLKSIKLRS